MFTILLNIVFVLCFLAWLACGTALVLFAFLTAAGVGRMLIRALYNIGHHAAARARLGRSHTQSLRRLGIKK